jgi:hypothetical protein
MPYEAERLLEHAQRLAVSRGWQRLQAMMLAEQVQVRCDCSAAMSQAQSNCSDNLNKWPPASEWMPNIPVNAPSLCLHPLATVAFFSPEARRRKPVFSWLIWSLIRKPGGQVNRSASAYALVIGLVEQWQNCRCAHDISASRAAG